MNPCIKTGANVYLQSHDAIVHGDLYRIGDTWYLVHCDEDTWNYAPQPGEVHQCHAHFNIQQAEVMQRFYKVPVVHFFDSKRTICLHDDFVSTNLGEPANDA